MLHLWAVHFHSEVFRTCTVIDYKPYWWAMVTHDYPLTIQDTVDSVITLHQCNYNGKFAKQIHHVKYNSYHGHFINSTEYTFILFYKRKLFLVSPYPDSLKLCSSSSRETSNLVGVNILSIVPDNLMINFL